MSTVDINVSLFGQKLIPLILLGVFKSSEGEEIYEIIDGMQRLNAIFSFIENKFAVSEKYFDVTKHSFANELSQAGVFEPVNAEGTTFLTLMYVQSF